MNRLPVVGAVTVLAAVGALAACAGPAPERSGGARSSASGSAPTSGSPKTGSPKTDSSKTGSPKTGSAKSEAPTDRSDDEPIRGRSEAATTGGFTIRHLENGHVKQIDVPDFKR